MKSLDNIEPNVSEKMAINNLLRIVNTQDLKYLYVTTITNYPNKKDKSNIFIVFNITSNGLIRFTDTAFICVLHTDLLGGATLYIIKSITDAKKFLNKPIVDKDDWFTKNEIPENKIFLVNKDKILSAINKVELLKSII